MKKPNFFLIGAAKAGTSSLWRYFIEHPEIYVPNNDLHKEPAYFCKSWGMNDWKEYATLFHDAANHHTAVGECSTAYLTCDESADRIHDYAKQNHIDVKIIIMLRNPADRAYSLYNWNVLSGLEPAADFKTALHLETKRMHAKLPSFWLPAPYRPHYLYFQTGLYCNQVSRFITRFSKNNIYIGLFEDFVDNPAQTTFDICRFLGVQEHPPLSMKQHNRSKSVVSPKLQVILRNLTRKLIKFNIISGFETITERDRLLAFGKKTSSPAPLAPDLRQDLQKQFQPDINKLEALIQRDLSIWLK